MSIWREEIRMIQLSIRIKDWHCHCLLLRYSTKRILVLTIGIIDKWDRYWVKRALRQIKKTIGGRAKKIESWRLMLVMTEWMGMEKEWNSLRETVKS
jgi:hypothetical protein